MLRNEDSEFSSPPASRTFWIRRLVPNWLLNIPFVIFHLLLLSLIWVQPTTTSLIICFVLYVVRMFGITAGYHRYFSHKAYKTSRGFQFVLAWIGACSLQKGPLWWASHHRDHHRHSDTQMDPHSPHTTSFWWSHVGWVLGEDFNDTTWRNIPDLKKYPELRMLDRLHWLPVFPLVAACYFIDGWAGVTWGFLLSTVILYHCTFFINSLNHLWGSRRFKTTDDSRNNFILAIVTLGEGWHNNHHHYQGSANQGFYWWEVDISYSALVVLSWFGIVWDLKRPKEKILNRDRIDQLTQEVTSVAGR